MSLATDSHRGEDNTHWMFSRKTLHMTGQLLRASHPALARRIHYVLSLQRMQDSDNPMLLPYASLTRALDAMIVTQIIAALTEVGRDWLSHPDDHPVSFEPLKGLLHQWIDLGDWIVCHSDADPC